jgi:hypothetical protein
MEGEVNLEEFRRSKLHFADRLIGGKYYNFLLL